MVLGAAPAWFAENVAIITVVSLGLLTVLILRVVQKLALRVMLLAVVAALALFVYANRFALEECADTCECQIADRDISLPACGTDLNG